MNLVDKLLQADAGKATELETKVIKSKRMSKILGVKDATEITIREIPAKRLHELMSMQFDKNGKVDPEKSFAAQTLVAAEALVEPSMKDKSLQEHFSCKTPKDLAMKLFGLEVKQIADEVVILSGYGDVEDTDEEIKN